MRCKNVAEMSEVDELTNRPCCDGASANRCRLGLSSVGRTVWGGMRRVEQVVSTWRNRQTRFRSVSCWRSQGRARRRKSEGSEED